MKANSKIRSKPRSSFKSKPASNIRVKPKSNSVAPTNAMSKPKSKPKPKPVSNMRSRPKLNVAVKKNPKPAPVQRENNRKAQQPTFERTKYVIYLFYIIIFGFLYRSEANSLARGCELGSNVKKIFDDEPKTMNDYMERERIRRQKGAKTSVKLSSSSLYKPRKKPMLSSQPVFESKQKPKSKSIVPTNAMSRLQIRKDIKKIDNRQIGSSTRSINKLGGSIANKPRSSRDLAFKRAAYFESLMQNQEE